MSIFYDRYDLLIERLAHRVNVKVEKSHDYMELLEITSSVKFFDKTVFTKRERDTWKRELLVSSIFESFNVFKIDQIHFYTRWLVVEEKFQYHESCHILKLILRSDFDSFVQIMELISMMPELTFDEITHILSVYGPELFEAFKHDWCIKKINKYVSKKAVYSTNYLSKLVDKLCSCFDVTCISKMFSCIKLVDNLRAIENLIDFCSHENIDLKDMVFENVELDELTCLIKIKHLCKCVKSQPESELEEIRFLKIVKRINSDGWSFVQLRELVTSFDLPRPFNRFQNLLHILSTIQNYNLSSSTHFEKCLQILIDANSFTDIIKQLNSLAIESHFQRQEKIKDLNEILDELKTTNISNHTLVDFIDTDSLDIMKMFIEEAAKSDWKEKDIKMWAKEIQEHKKEFSDYEAIAVILRANFIVTRYTLTDIQKLCSLIALRSGDNLKGKLLEVATGEGKSTIICILAIIHCLRGRQVDVITTSPVLAARDATQKGKIYQMFGLTCSENSDKTVYLKGAKDCYKVDVVYGEMSQFQFDVLRDNYSKLGTLGGRKCTTAIVDEVDSMLIDDSSKISRLSSTVPGMDHFHTIYVFIWQHLTSIKQKLIIMNTKWYFVNGKLGFEDGRFTLEFANENGDIDKIPDLENYFLTETDISRAGEVVCLCDTNCLCDDIDSFLRKNLKNYLDSQLRENKIYIPGNFADFLERQKSKWITNAIEALNYQENVHYVVRDGEIKPVDYYSTGIVQSSTNWSNGLHQFIQLKHNLKMTCETLTTNFLSNIGFISKYERVCGLTGTLGSETARDMLQSVYKVELVNMPQRRKTQYRELEPIVAECETNWLKEITLNVMLEIQKERGVWVICETIEQANRISEMLKHKLLSSAVKLYTMNDLNQEKHVENILPGEVIIATNLAGRGTDIQTDEIEVSGGLHVILTFMPNNQRVEDQAFGRTSRQGKRGTGMMILNAQSLLDYTNTTSKEAMKIERDAMESAQLKEFKDNELKLIQIKDKLFDRFCSFLNDEICLTIKKEHDSSARQMKNRFSELLPTPYESNMLAAVEEQWAAFLNKLDDGRVKCENAEIECIALLDQLRNDFEHNVLVKNPYYYICIANDILVNEWTVTDSSKAKRALDYFQQAIKLKQKQTSQKAHQVTGHSMKLGSADVKSSECRKKASEPNGETMYGIGAAHLGVAWCLILLKEDNYKEKALASLRTALKCLSNEMSVLNATQLILEQTQVEFVNSDLYKQLNVKATLLGSYMNGIDACTSAVKLSKRMMDVVAVKKFNAGKGLLETIHHFNEQERNEENSTQFKSKDVKLSSNETYSLRFHDLTTKGRFRYH